MNKNFIYTFVFAITGAIVGAGFASGREIASFFAKYGFWCIPFIFVAGALFFAVFFLFGKIGSKLRPGSVSDITKKVFGKAGIVVDVVFIISSFITLSSMLAGLDSTMQIAIGDKYVFPFVSILAAIVVVIILNYGLKKIFQFTDRIIPFMFSAIFVVVIGFLIFAGKQQVGYSQINHNIFSMGISPILYVCMNTFGNMFLIAKTSSYLKKKQIIIACLISSILLSVCILLVAICILFGGEAVFASDMPMLTIAYNLGTGFGIIYLITLFVAIFTTICTTAFAISTWLNNYISNKFVCAVIVMSIGFVFSRFGFATIVDVFYPIEGVFGLIFILICLVYLIKQRKLDRQQQTLPIVDALEVTKKDGKVQIKKSYRKKDKIDKSK